MVTGDSDAVLAARVIVCAVHSANVLAEVVRAHPGFELVERVVEPSGLERALLRTGANAVVLGAEVRDPVGRCRRLLERFPELRILALCDAERSGVLLRAGMPARELCDLSLGELLDTVSAQAAGGKGAQPG